MTSPWLEGLNPQQQSAVKITEGPLLILAGAGSGKTTVLVSRAGHLVSSHKAKAHEILVLTFTNKAAKELKERVKSKIGKQGEKIWAGTFHGFGLEFLKKNHKLADLPARFGLLDATDAKAVLKELLKDHKHFGKSGFDIETLQGVMGALRSKKSPPVGLQAEYYEVAEWILPKYIDKMHALGVVDFDGLILRPTEILRNNSDLSYKYKNKFKYIMVDEFQDTNKIQMDFIKAICNDQENLAVVGDDDQSIYGWRGAEISNILGFPRRFKNCQVVRLEINYRSTPSILNMANALIVKNQERHTKTLIPHRPEDKGSLPELFIFEDEETECERIIELIREHIKEGCSLKDISVLFRSNSQGALLEGYLRNERLPYEMTGGPALIDRREVRDVLAYLRAALMPNDICLRRILNVPARGIGDQSVAKIIEYQKEHDLSFHQALKQWPKTQIAERVGQSIDGFFSVLAQMENQLLNPQEAYSTLLPKIFYELGYKQVVLGAYKEKGVGQRKWQLVEILGRILDGFIGRGGASIKTIRDFLDTLELRDTDSSEDSEDKIQLLTFHASKGLEYPVVILMGVDDGLIPHETLGSNVSEERRLFYVGLTRAKKQLILTRCLQRRRYGKMREVSPSRFLMDIPESHFTTYEGGYRPIVESDRKQMIADLFKRIDDKKKDYSSEL